MFKVKNRTIVISSLVVLVVIAGYFNFRLANENDQETGAIGNLLSSATATPGSADETATTVSADTIAQFATDRQTSREDEIKYLDEVINSNKSDAETIKKAQEQKLAIVDMMESEVTIEGLLKSKGFQKVVVTMSDNSVNVIVSATTLTDAQVAQVLDIVCQETNRAPEQVKIIPVK